MALSLPKLIADRYSGRDLPIALVLPDGARVPLSPRLEVDVIARTFAGLRALASPALGALARAYVHNDVDFTGSARRVLAIAEAMVGDIAHGRDSVTSWFRHVLHQCCFFCVFFVFFFVVLFAFFWLFFVLWL